MSKNIVSYFQNSLKQYPDKTAIVYNDKLYSYKDVANDILKLSFFLKQSGVKKGSHCLIFLDNSYDFIITMFSIANIGAVMVPVDISTKNIKLNQIIKNTDCEFVITHRSFLKDFETAISKININNFYNSKDLDKFDLDVDVDSDYILTMTSGSTGEPKSIIFTQETKIKRAILSAKDLYNLSNDEAIIVASPMYHSMGQRLSLLPLLIGGTSVILSRFNISKWIETVNKYNVTFTIAISSHIEQLVIYSYEHNVSIDSVHTLVSSSSLLNAKIKKAFLEKFDIKFHECYGTSEVGIATNLSPDDIDVISSVGKALPFVDLKIVDNSDNEVKNGTIGQIVVKSKTAFKGYYKDELKTKQSIKDGYFYTGDLGYLDDNGYLYLAGRSKDVIIVGGTNVYPVEIESVILSIDGVIECSVIGVKDEYFSEAILAVLVVKDNFDLNVVKLECLKQLADYQQPMAYEIVDALPKNSLGKIMKYKLKEQFKDYKIDHKIMKLFNRD